MTNAELLTKLHEITVIENRGINLKIFFIRGLYFSQVAEQSPKKKKKSRVVVGDREQGGNR